METSSEPARPPAAAAETSSVEPAASTTSPCSAESVMEPASVKRVSSRKAWAVPETSNAALAERPMLRSPSRAVATISPEGRRMEPSRATLAPDNSSRAPRPGAAGAGPEAGEVVSVSAPEASRLAVAPVVAVTSGVRRARSPETSSPPSPEKSRAEAASMRVAAKPSMAVTPSPRRTVPAVKTRSPVSGVASGEGAARPEALSRRISSARNSTSPAPKWRRAGAERLRLSTASEPTRPEPNRSSVV